MWGLWEIVKAIRDAVHQTEYVIPHQLLQLVRQAHLGDSHQTTWDIRMSEEMRMALRAPLTAQQIQTLSQRSDDAISISVDGYVLSHKYRDRELSGVVCASIDISDRLGVCNYKYSDVKLRITIRQTGDPIDKRWAVSSVERVS